MESIIINTSSLPSEARKYFHTRKVEMQERDGGVFFTPVEPPSLLGIAAHSPVTTELYFKHQAEEKRLEG
ncbi:MAG: hypothetical protein FWC27_02570 [Firmicutes bacterium]|nr:hypothetical protein [Bacillota bacterium]